MTYFSANEIGVFYSWYFYVFYSFLALRLRGAVLEIVYTKLLRVRSLKDKTVGHVSGTFSNNIFQEIVSF